ncbi:uncharacterized protein FOMMEDRAFT_130511 [Fomitiporia mediterranea MF3/22]|uniref:uncharacterized protein n=1 Tax=Fomitiporia mediterranea (strain MF3/22) TaxID=694068 RepID=UPI0004408F41|nr:uncharacterized protein FOMMEDRAFT_130511 [Fomitiporia mediterranea MF3/22]EJD07279.1 hypothetical protein FOMMEDRAFT_130511 [Fomitiporia mediterranea MF3/22]
MTKLFIVCDCDCDWDPDELPDMRERCLLVVVSRRTGPAIGGWPFSFSGDSYAATRVCIDCVLNIRELPLFEENQVTHLNTAGRGANISESSRPSRNHDLPVEVVIDVGERASFCMLVYSAEARLALLRQQNRSNKRRSNARTPPTTPPIIAPIFRCEEVPEVASDAVSPGGNDEGVTATVIVEEPETMVTEEEDVEESTLLELPSEDTAICVWSSAESFEALDEDDSGLEPDDDAEPVVFGGDAGVLALADEEEAGAGAGAGVG